MRSLIKYHVLSPRHCVRGWQRLLYCRLPPSKAYFRHDIKSFSLKLKTLYLPYFHLRATTTFRANILPIPTYYLPIPSTSSSRSQLSSFVVVISSYVIKQLLTRMMLVSFLFLLRTKKEGMISHLFIRYGA